MIAKTIWRGLQRIGLDPYRNLDRLFLPMDFRRVRRTRNLRLIPTAAHRRGGKVAFGEWAHVIGIFQTLMLQNLTRSEGNRILDVGCGTGLLGVAAEPFLGEGGQYIGLDVARKDIEFCRGHFPSDRYDFRHLEVRNPAYAADQGIHRAPWPVEAGSVDLITALSVWTHLDEPDARFYFQEIARVLKPGGRALVTFFLLDEAYRRSLALRTSGTARFHRLPRDRWIFDRPCRGSEHWFHPAWAEIPEHAVGVTEIGLTTLCQAAGLECLERLPGNWKEIPGIYFQDVLVFRRGLR